MCRVTDSFLNGRRWAHVAEPEGRSLALGAGTDFGRGAVGPKTDMPPD
jgi:hypothetical protein